MAETDGARRRNLHDERSEDTRARLLEATIRSLVEVGYARTSTTEIADRAGVSRGAQVYHYPTKAALVAAAVEHLLERRYEEMRALLDGPAESGGPAEALDLLWRIFEGPTFAAWIEFVAASRTDAELRGALIRHSEPFVSTVVASLRKRLPAIERNPFFAKPDFLFALLDGLALARFLYPDEDRADRMLAAFREIAGQLQPGGAASAAPKNVRPSSPARRPTKQRKKRRSR